MKKIVTYIVIAAAIGGFSLQAHADLIPSFPAMPGIQVSDATAQTVQLGMTAQLVLGMRGDDVKALQSFLAQWSDIYPGGYVTGYFGPLTQKAVARFQAKYGIPATGNVGNLTLKRINEILGVNNGPIISELKAENLSADTIRISWNTDKPASTEVMYDTANPVRVGTALVVKDPSLTMKHTVDVSHLNPATMYYFVVASARNANGPKTTNQISTSTLAR